MPLLRFIPETTNVDFVKYRWWAFGVDGLLMVASVVSFFYLNFNLGLDFTGGVEMEIRARQSIDIAQVRSQVEALNFGHPTVTTIGGGACNTPVNSCAVIRIAPQAGRGTSDQQVVAVVRKQLGPSYTYPRTDYIGPKVSGELFQQGVLATVFAVIMISVWVWFRFEWQYGVGALIATGHDVLVVAGFYSVFQWEFNLNTVAALLLLAGYSINDTVVVFDRIRENRRKYKRMSLPDLINLSTNHIATRTTLVSVATALSVVPLLFGGPVLLNFSRAILIGILVGTFSSTYVAAMLLLYLPATPGSVEANTGSSEATA
jgi:preprotein translocase SecF subunit